jgi:NADH dehydrogenase
MRIAIFGGTGQVGTVITKKVFDDFPKSEILSCSRSGSGLKGFKFNVFQEDWSVLGKLDVIINSVGIIEEKGENTFDKIHIEVVNKILKERERIGKPKIIHISVLGADKKSPSRYASTKGIADEILQKEDNWNIIRPSFVCTPGTAIINKVLMLKNMAKWQLGFLPCPAHFLSAKFQPVMGVDLAFVAIECIKQNLTNQVIYGTGPDIFSLEDWIRIAGKGKIKIIKIPKKLIDIPFRILIKIFPRIMSIDQYLLLGEDNVHEHSLLEEILNRKPQSTFQFWNKELTKN